MSLGVSIYLGSPILEEARDSASGAGLRSYGRDLHEKGAGKVTRMLAASTD